MTISEISRKFDIGYNNIMSDGAPGLTMYEKSCFLTQAQDEIEIALYNGDLKGGFEHDEEVRRYLNSVTKRKSIKVIEESSEYTHVVQGSYLFKKPEDMLFAVYETVTYGFSGDECTDGMVASVVPVSYDELNRILRNPFRRQNTNRALRIDAPKAGDDEITEIISNEIVEYYNVVYLKKLAPIILENLHDGITIKGECYESAPEMDDSIMDKIIDRAVALAYQSFHLNN